MQIIHSYAVDYRDKLVLDKLDFDLVQNDGGSDVIEVTVTDNGTAADLSEAVVTLYFVLENGTTPFVAMTVVGNVASAPVPVEATPIAKRVYMYVKIAVPGITRTVLHKY